MTDATVTLAGSPVSREEVAQFEQLAAHAGYQFGCGKVKHHMAPLPSTTQSHCSHRN